MTQPDEVTTNSLGRLIERSLFSSWRAVMSVTVLSAITGFLASTVAARALGAEAYGIYAIGINTLTMTVAIATIGYPMAILRFGPPLLLQNDRSRFAVLIYSALKRTLGLAILLVTIGIVAVFFLPKIAPKGRPDVLIVMLLASPIAIWGQIYTAANRAYGHLELALLPDAIAKNIVIVGWGSFVLLNLWPIARNPVDFAFAYLIGLTVSGLLVYLVYRRSGGRLRKPISDWSADRRWFISAIGFFSHYIIGVVRNNADVFFVAAVATTKDAGIFVICLKMGEILAAIAGTLNYVLTPRISMAFAAGDIPGIQREQRSAAWVLSGFAICVGTPLIVWAHTWLSFFGPDFAQGVWTLRLAVVAGMIPCIAGPTYQILSMSGNEWLVTRIETAGMIVQLVALAILISPLGAFGAAAARCIGLLVSVGAAWWTIKSKLGLTLGAASLVLRPAPVR